MVKRQNQGVSIEHNRPTEQAPLFVLLSSLGHVTHTTLFVMTESSQSTYLMSCDHPCRKGVVERSRHISEQPRCKRHAVPMIKLVQTLYDVNLIVAKLDQPCINVKAHTQSTVNCSVWMKLNRAPSKYCRNCCCVAWSRFGSGKYKHSRYVHV